MRYAHQPYSEVRRMPVRRLVQFAEAVMELIAAENKRGQMER